MHAFNLKNDRRLLEFMFWVVFVVVKFSSGARTLVLMTSAAGGLVLL